MRVKSLTLGKQVALTIDNALGRSVDEIKRHSDIEPLIGTCLEMPRERDQVSECVVEALRDGLETLVSLE